MSPPMTRKLRVFAFDPLLGYDFDFLQSNETTLEDNWGVSPLVAGDNRRA
jgi:hypothetical protein